MLKHTKKPTIHKTEVVPEVSFAFPKQEAKPTSNKPPIINNNQFIIEKFKIKFAKISQKNSFKEPYLHINGFTVNNI